VDDGLAEARVDRQMPEEQPVVEGPVDQVDRDVWIDVGSDLSSLLSAPDHLAGGVTTDGHELLIDAAQRLGIGLCLTDELSQAAARVARKQLGDDMDLSDQRRLGSGRSGKRNLVGDRAEQRLDHQRVLGRPPPVDRGLTDPCGPGDALDREVADTDRLQQVQRRREDRAVGGFAARPARPRAIACGHHLTNL
jgi:hypothetical protein